MVPVENDIYGYRIKLTRLEEDFAKADPQVLTWEKQPLSPYTEEFTGRLRNKFSIFPRVVDLGSGTGRRTVQLAEEFNLEIVGVEITRNGIQRSQELLRQTNLRQGKVLFTQDDMRELGFLDASFDGVHSYGALMHLHMNHWEHHFEEVARVLKPGGMFLIVTFSGEDEDYFGTPVKEMNIGWVRFNGNVVRIETRNGERYDLDHGYPREWTGYSWWFATEEDILRAARNNFRVIRLDHLRHPGQDSRHKGQRYYLNVLLERV